MTITRHYRRASLVGMVVAHGTVIRFTPMVAWPSRSARLRRYILATRCWLENINGATVVEHGLRQQLLSRIPSAIALLDGGRSRTRWRYYYTLPVSIVHTIGTHHNVAINHYNDVRGSRTMRRRSVITLIPYCLALPSRLDGIRRWRKWSCADIRRLPDGAIVSTGNDGGY